MLCVLNLGSAEGHGGDAVKNMKYCQNKNEDVKLMDSI